MALAAVALEKWADINVPISAYNVRSRSHERQACNAIRSLGSAVEASVKRSAQCLIEARERQGFRLTDLQFCTWWGWLDVRLVVKAFDLVRMIDLVLSISTSRLRRSCLQTSFRGSYLRNAHEYKCPPGSVADDACFPDTTAGKDLLRPPCAMVSGRTAQALHDGMKRVCATPCLVLDQLLT